MDALHSGIGMFYTLMRRGSCSVYSWWWVRSRSYWTGGWLYRTPWRA